MTTRDVYVRHSFKISAVFSVVLCALSLLATANLGDRSCSESSSAAAGAVPTTHMFPGDVSPAGLYAIYLAITLLVSRHENSLNYLLTAGSKVILILISWGKRIVH